jgi:hypothetical protein
MRKQKKKDLSYKICTSCGKSRLRDKYFYLSNSPFDSDGRVPVCKDCINNNVDVSNTESVKAMLARLNRPFIVDMWLRSLEEGKKQNKNPFGMYMKTLNLNEKYRELTHVDTNDGINNNSTIYETNNINQSDDFLRTEMSPEDLRNKEDVIRQVGYDPFETEHESDRRHLYNKLVDFLDESTLEDSFKLPAVIEIVKTFNQIDKINHALTRVTQTVNDVTNNIGNIKSLFEAKEKMLKSILALAKDNGISVNYNNNKSKGAGTLSGIIKQLHEIGLEAAEINLFDIETAAGMKQVADISNRSIMEQLNLNENDYTEMIKEQREMIVKMQDRITELEEENRLLKMKNKNYEEKS